MSLTREQFYNKAIRPNLARFSSMVKVRDIMPHLSCLTQTDREEIEAKRDMSGNFIAMQTLLDNLRRRENWPEEFIKALMNCEHRELADEMSTAYDRIRGITNNTAASAAPVPRPAPTPAPSYSSAGATATVIQATIHTVPATTSPLLIPPAGEVPAHSNAPSIMAAPEPSPAPVLKVPETQQVQELPTPVQAPSLEPVSQVEIAPSQAPPPAVVSKVPTHTGPAENKTHVLDTPDGLALADQTTTSSTGGTPLSTSSAQPSSSNTSQIQITQPCTTFQSSHIQVPIPVKDTSTSEKLPVQDTNPPLKKGTIQGPTEISDPTANELVQRNNTVGLPVLNSQTNSTITGQATSSAPTEGVMHSPSSIDQEYFSKPGILQPEPQQNRAETLPVLPEDPCSVVSDELEISRETECSTELSNIPPPLTPNQPEEDHYESVFESQTLTNLIQYAEQAPAENLNGQPPSMLQHSRVISEDQHTLNHVGTENIVPLSDPSGHDSEASDCKKSATINYQEQESNARPATILQPEQREEGRPELFRINNFQLIAAAATGITLSVFLAWKLKH
ncbi:mitochondrial antiviral-signaling protein [Pseudorasbora parva]|uniref:mitochondrial antiviral-signaling protein n=1 Tax=Pseudorasbora parva TaxID=51549 RepID=UPI00351F5DA9